MEREPSPCEAPPPYSSLLHVTHSGQKRGVWGGGEGSERQGGRLSYFMMMLMVLPCFVFQSCRFVLSVDFTTGVTAVAQVLSVLKCICLAICSTNTMSGLWSGSGLMHMLTSSLSYNKNRKYIDIENTIDGENKNQETI